MPPLPSKLDEDAVALISATERRYKHLSQVEVPKLSQCIGPLSLQQSLAEGIREDTLALARQIEDLELMVDDQQGERNRRELKAIVEDFQQRLDNLRKDTRVALLTSKQAIDSQNRSNREELMAMSSVMEEKQTSNEKITENVLMKANSDVTDALRRTIALMQSELERSVLTTQILDDSTSTLRSTSLQHDALNSVMDTSKYLITALEKSDWLDRVLIISAFVFFLLVILFILKQRVLDRGLRMAFWWTRFIPSFSDDAEWVRDAEKVGAGVVVGVSSSLSVAIASLASSVDPSTATVMSSITGTLVPVSTISDTLASSASSDSTAPPPVADPCSIAVPPSGPESPGPIHVEL